MAYTPGLARASEVGFNAEEQQSLLQVGHAALLEFEISDLGFRVDPKVLESFKNNELLLWRSREKELFPYRLVPAKYPPPISNSYCLVTKITGTMKSPSKTSYRLIWDGWERAGHRSWRQAGRLTQHADDGNGEHDRSAKF